MGLCDRVAGAAAARREPAEEDSSEGVYETTKPIPVNGDWKALLRVHKGDAILGAPIYLPNDPASPGKGGAGVRREFTRRSTADHKILQREAKSASGVLPMFAYGRSWRSRSRCAR